MFLLDFMKKKSSFGFKQDLQVNREIVPFKLVGH